MQAGRDRDLLRDWIESLDRYSVSTYHPGDALPDEYDLCILDRAALERSRTELLANQEAADLTFLPCLLVTPGDADLRVTEFVDEESEDRPLVDDVVSLPVDQSILQRRIDHLLNARQASLRLEEREQQYEQLVNLTPESILILQEGTIVYSNAAANDVFAGGTTGAADGKIPTGTRADLDGRSIETLVTTADRPAFREYLRTIEHEGRTDRFRHLTMRTVAGDLVEAEIAGARVTFGDAPATQLLVRDVTAEYDREQRLTLFGRAIQTAIQGVTIADARQEDNPLVYANDAFERITGYSKAEIMGRNCRFLQGARTDEATVDRMREAIAAERPVTVEVLNYRKDGTPFWNQVDIVPVTDDEGEVTHFLGLQRDVTDRRGREERLQVFERVLRHNLRNRMNVITGLAERLKGSDDPTVVDAAETIERSAQNLLAISEQINDFGTLIDREQQDVESYDAADVLARVADGFRAEYPRANVSFVAPETAPVTGHRLLPAALEEFLELAVEEEESPPDLEIVVRDGEQWVTIEIVDHGGTIPASEFRAVEEGETPIEHPQGLELWLVRWAVLHSGGDLAATRENGRRIVIRLPRGADDATP